MVQSINITNGNGRFHAGMTLAEAKAKGVDKCTFRRDFYNLDKNHDGVLSVEEIMAEREYDANCEKWSAAAFGIMGLLDFMTSNSRGERLFWIGFDALITAYSLYNLHKINKQTAEYNEILYGNNRNKLDKKA